MVPDTFSSPHTRCRLSIITQKAALALEHVAADSFLTTPQDVPGSSHYHPASGELGIYSDGRAWVTRTRANRPLDLLPESYTVPWFKPLLPPPLANRCPMLIFARGPKAVLGYVSWEERLQMVWMLPKGSWAESRQHDWLQACAPLPDSLARHILTHQHAPEGPVYV